MITFFLIGNIASGKSTAARYLERRGAMRIDLDQLAKDLYQPGSAVVDAIAEEFGWDVPTPWAASTGLSLLAVRSIRRRTPTGSTPLSIPSCWSNWGFACCRPTAVPSSFPSTSSPWWRSLPRRALPMRSRWQMGIAVTAPLETRRLRAAVERGMDADDFDRRAECQPAEKDLVAMATFVIDNALADDSLFRELDALVDRYGLDLPAAEESLHG